MRPSSLWLTVDPGIRGTGYCLMDGIKVLRFQSLYPAKVCRTWEQCSSSIVAQFDTLIIHRIAWVYIEWPAQFTGAKGLAASNSNDILKLACLIGRITQHFVAKGARVITVPVQRWKGNLPKLVVAARAEKFFGIRGLKSHAADAVGMARFVLKNGGFHGGK